MSFQFSLREIRLRRDGGEGQRVLGDFQFSLREIPGSRGWSAPEARGCQLSILSS